MIMKIIISVVVLTAALYVWAWMLCRAAARGDSATLEAIDSPAFDPIRDRIRSRRKDASGTRP